LDKSAGIPEASLWYLLRNIADAGKAWSRDQVLSEQPWYAGYGAGFQFLLPYGFTIRTEAAINNAGETEYILDFDTSF